MALSATGYVPNASTRGARAMEAERKLSLLLELAESVGLAIRHMPSTGGDAPPGALVRLKGREIIFLDPSAAACDQISVVAPALRNRKELDDVFVPPEIRQAIDEPDE